MRQSSDPIAVPAIDLKLQYQSIRGEIDEAIRRVVENQAFILGPEVEGLEREVAEYCQCKFAYGLSSGSDALSVALMAIEEIMAKHPVPILVVTAQSKAGSAAAFEAVRRGALHLAEKPPPGTSPAERSSRAGPDSSAPEHRPQAP